jgi:hypothetical protein
MKGKMGIDSCIRVSVHRFPAQRDLRQGSTFRVRDKDKIEDPKSS